MELESGRTELGAMGVSLQPQTPSRHEKSLGLLTTKFVTLLQEAKDGVLDLKAVSMPYSLLLARGCKCSLWLATVSSKSNSRFSQATVSHQRDTLRRVFFLFMCLNSSINHLVCYTLPVH